MKTITYSFQFLSEIKKFDRETRSIVDGLIDAFADGWDGEQVIREDGIQIAYQDIRIRVAETETTIEVRSIQYQYD